MFCAFHIHLPQLRWRVHWAFFALGAIDSAGALVGAGLGLAMAQMPLPPQLSRMLLALDLGCSEALSLAAVLSVQSFVDPRGRSSLNDRLDAVAELGVRSDHVTCAGVQRVSSMADADTRMVPGHRCGLALRRRWVVTAFAAPPAFATSGANAGGRSARVVRR